MRSRRVLEPCLPADARLDRLAVECDTLRLELRTRGVDVRHAKSQPCGRRRERLLDARRIEDVECDLSAPKLHVALTLGLDLEPEDLRVEALARGKVLRQEGHEVDVLDLHHGFEPSEYGAWRWCRISEFPSGSLKNAMWQTPES